MADNMRKRCPRGIDTALVRRTLLHQPELIAQQYTI